MHFRAPVQEAQRVSSAAAEERRDEGPGKRRLPAVGCNAGLEPTVEHPYDFDFKVFVSLMEARAALLSILKKSQCQSPREHQSLK